MAFKQGPINTFIAGLLRAFILHCTVASKEGGLSPSNLPDPRPLPLLGDLLPLCWLDNTYTDDLYEVIVGHQGFPKFQPQSIPTDRTLPGH